MKRGVVFGDQISWKQAPRVASQLSLMDKGVTPTVVEWDQDTAFFDSEVVDSAMENCTFCVSESASMEAGGELLCHCVEKVGEQLKNVWVHIKWVDRSNRSAQS